MTHSVQYLNHSSDIPEEGDFNVCGPSDITRVKTLVDGIKKRVGGAIKNMKVKQKEFLENQRQVEEIAIACEESGYDDLIPYASLIRQSGNVNEKDPAGRTALISAAFRDDTKIVKLLLARPEILANEKDGFGNTAIMLVFMNNHTEIIKLFLARPEILLNEKNSNGNTAFIYVITVGHTEITKLLLSDLRLNLRAHDQGKKALEQPGTPEIKSLIEVKMREQGIEF